MLPVIPAKAAMTSKKPLDQTFPKQTGISVALPAHRRGGARGVGFLRPRGSPKRGCDGQAEAFGRGLGEPRT
jgi:hypothetical protein